MYIRNIKLLSGQIPGLDPELITHVYFNMYNHTMFVLQPARKEKRFDSYMLTSLEIEIGKTVEQKNMQLLLFTVPILPNRFEHITYKWFESKITICFKKRIREYQITFISESNTINVMMVFMEYLENNIQPFPWLIRNPDNPVFAN